ncbi:conjugal transfer protein TraY [Vibrio parahaemolyticus]|uniref:TraY domain-containing protein n=1 Tax=Vibrio parahaemolyticus TaxID=670 RepID=UPI0011224743|nr:TraY domain-containing protein [Vibrio parahaemolyticus]TOR11921.1 conjugal transfer protein TraY [Vibrio parahaemolyticus]UJW92770.1 TraY domain-containing protein [Vibrio parahaemolyticus]UJX06935.1 TraY domain-containing protein [Vibrio parahaemolyticus]UJX07005.1 TraY domain-containing protein [Vibrio parahaemolyticus]WCZ09848.1 TraY domain-containing protein [Vibrio parahaemolyticus]
MPSKAKEGMTGIWFEMDAETNRRLTESARINKRTKRQEASFRLADHLAKFDKNLKPRTNLS